MTIKERAEKKKRRRLSWEILELVGAGALIALLAFVFLYFASMAISETYLTRRGFALDQRQLRILTVWIRSVCMAASAVVFVAVFLFLIGQKISYLLFIISGVEALRQRELDFEISVKGNDELTELAESINYLSLSQREINQKEQRLKEERETLIRSLSHDIRTPLTSILSYTEYMEGKKTLQPHEVEGYLSMVRTKAEQMKVLTDRLLGKREKKKEKIENGLLLMEQLAAEWEEALEDEFCCQVDLGQCQNFSGNYDIHDLRRIFDNLASNAAKYADPQGAVKLQIQTQENRVWIRQRNKMRVRSEGQVESHKIGLESVRQIAEEYSGEMKVEQTDMTFEVEIGLEAVELSSKIMP